MDQIESVFGNTVYPSKLYGGRPYNFNNSLTDKHIETLNKKSIGLTLTLTNHYFDKGVYEANEHLLERHHQDGNFIVCYNDELAKQIKKDYPKYKIKASLIKNLNTIVKVKQALELYDYAVIPMEMNDDDAFLKAQPEKERIILFGNATCAYGCQSRICYAGISKQNRGKNEIAKCSRDIIPGQSTGHIYFDVSKFADMGYRLIKLVPNAYNVPSFIHNNLLNKSKKQRLIELSLFNPDWIIQSYPKCGRTWLRMILGHYLNSVFKLNVNVNLQSVFTLLPNDNTGLKGFNNYQFSHMKNIPRIIWSHSRYKNKYFEDKPYILLLRSIFDTVVSDFFHTRHLFGYEGSLSQFIRDEQGGFAKYCNYLNYWGEKSDQKPALVITYEQLHENTIKQCRGLIEALGIPVNMEGLEQAIELSSFNKMRDSEESHGVADLKKAISDSEGVRVRKGIVGGYKDYMNESDIRYIKSEIKKRLTAPVLKLVEKYKLDQ